MKAELERQASAARARPDLKTREATVENNLGYRSAQVEAVAKCDRLAVAYRNTNPDAASIATAIAVELHPEIDKILEARDAVLVEHDWAEDSAEVRAARVSAIKASLRERAIMGIIKARSQDAKPENTATTPATARTR